MTTVVNPASSPTVVYNRSGTTIVSLAAGTVSQPNQPSSGGGAEIPVVSGYTVVLLSPPSSWNTSDWLIAVLPSNREIGDVVEVYSVNGFYTGTNPARSIILYPPVGESLNNSPTNTGSISDANSSVDPGIGKIFRKVSATNWQSIG